MRTMLWLMGGFLIILAGLEWAFQVTGVFLFFVLGFGIIALALGTLAGEEM